MSATSSTNHSSHASHAMPMAPPKIGVRIAGTGHCLPEKRLTNDDLSRIIDTNHDWIVQRTGIHERRVCDPENGESVRSLSTEALRNALADARMDATKLDLIILASVSADTRVPSTACRVADALGATNAGALDIIVACSGFVYGMNMAHDLIRSGTHKAVGVVGCDAMSTITDPLDRRTAILFGDAAGAAVFTATDDVTKGVLAQSMSSDGSHWMDLYLPFQDRDLPDGATWDDLPPGCLRMNGREVYRFAVSTFRTLIDETLEKAGISADDVDLFVAHQSNLRILESARQKFGIPEEKMYVNIDRYGNSSAGSVPLCLSELRQQKRIHEGDIVLFLAFGAGLTWASSLWRM